MPATIVCEIGMLRLSIDHVHTNCADYVGPTCSDGLVTATDCIKSANENSVGLGFNLHRDEPYVQIRMRHPGMAIAKLWMGSAT
jgi:hypothetical protein